jgi:hypothetical protein
LIVGPQRAGTTWIHDYLASRDDVTLAHAVKETLFFDRNYRRGLDWYAKHFRGRAGCRIVEVGPTYFHHEAAPERVAADLGRVPVVATLRDPVARTHSLWIHMRRYGMTSLAFADALDRFPELVESSLYATHVERWRRALGATNVHVLFMEQLRDAPAAYAESVCRALDLPVRDLPVGSGTRVNEGSLPRSHRLADLGQKVSDALRSAGLYGVVNAARRVGLKPVFFGSPGERKPAPPTDEERARLLERFLPEIVRLEGMLGVDLAAWKT